MKIQSINSYKYRIPFFKSSYYSKGQEFANGAIIHVAFDSIPDGWGEISFINCREETNYDSIEWQIEALKIAVINEDFLFDDLINQIGIHITSKHARFGLELALYDALSKAESKKLSKKLNPGSSNLVVTNGLIGASDDLSNYDVIKIKTQSNNSIIEADRIKAIAKKYPDAKLRIDGNGSFDLTRGIRFLHSLSELNIDYVEQLINKDNLDDMYELSLHSEFPLAADESIYNKDSAMRIIDSSSIGVIVIKPSQFGGISEIADISAIADKNKIRIVFTHSFETAIGRMGNIHISSAFTDEACGFGMEKYLVRDFSNEGISDCSELYISDIAGHGINPILSSLEDFIV